MKTFKVRCTDAQIVRYLKLFEAAGFEIYHATKGATSMGEYAYLTFTGERICRGNNSDYETITIGQAIDRSLNALRDTLEARIAELKAELETL